MSGGFTFGESSTPASGETAAVSSQSAGDWVCAACESENGSDTATCSVCMLPQAGKAGQNTFTFPDEPIEGAEKVSSEDKKEEDNKTDETEKKSAWYQLERLP